MEKEQIIKALELHSTGSVDDCKNCPYDRIELADDETCANRMCLDTLALIKSQDEQIFQLENRLKECENGYAGTLHLESCKLHDAEEKIKELTEENERLTKANEVYAELEQGCLVTGVKKVQANTVRKIFKEIYSSLDYIEEQMEPEEIPECFFSVREDINALKVRFEGEGRVE